jgi:hypothetical protein
LNGRLRWLIDITSSFSKEIKVASKLDPKCGRKT